MLVPGADAPRRHVPVPSRAIVASAPSRVNLIGEHTDYNGGYVLPTPLPQKTTVRVTPRSDDLVRTTGVELGSDLAGEYQLGSEHRRNGWLDYVQGVTWALSQKGFRLSGFNLHVSSDAPVGKGLSSSASLELAVLRALKKFNDLAPSDLDLAMLAHRAETDFVGAPVGIIGQLVCSLGDQRSAFFLDARLGTFENIPMPHEILIGVIDSGITRRHTTGDYRIRRRECDEAAAKHLGVEQLRDLTPSDMPAINPLPEPLTGASATSSARTRGCWPLLAPCGATTPRPSARCSFNRMRRCATTSPRRGRKAINSSSSQATIRMSSGHGSPAAVSAELSWCCAGDRAHDATAQVVRQYREATHQDGRVLLPLPKHNQDGVRA